MHAMSHLGPPSPIASLARRLLHKHPHDPLHRCAPSVLGLLHASLTALLSPPATPQRDPTDALTTLRHLADRKINTLPFHAVTPEWLRLYTDATLALVLARIQGHEPGSGAEWKTWVRWLDMVIIVAGAVGPEREEYVAELITWVQRVFAHEHVQRFARMAERDVVDDDDHHDDDDDLNPSTSRKRRKTSALTPPAIHYAPLPIPSPSSPPLVPPATPIILRAYLDPFSCPANRLWASPAYLLSRAGPGRYVPVEIGASYTDREWGQRVVPFEVFLRRVGYDLTGLCDAPVAVSSADDGEDDLPRDQPVYLAQHDLLAQFPSLRRDIGPLPDYIYTAPSMHDGKPYEPPGNEQGLVMNVWVGSGGGTHGREVTSGVASPAHTDPYFNCYLQILGTKRVWLAPPHVADAMDAFPERHAASAEDASVSEGENNEEDNVVTSYTTNTSRVPIFANPDRRLGKAYEARYERFYDRAWPESREAVLQPGDMLLMPPKWWHAMRSEGDGVAWSLSMWY